ncbi:hypothetical protein QEN19_003200 [Hanseniaspora menglaensis]
MTETDTSPAAIITNGTQKYNIKELYLQFLSQDSDLTMPIAAIESLIQILKTYNPTTSAEMINIINGSIKELTENIPNTFNK